MIKKKKPMTRAEREWVKLILFCLDLFMIFQLPNI